MQTLHRLGNQQWGMSEDGWDPSESCAYLSPSNRGLQESTCWKEVNWGLTSNFSSDIFYLQIAWLCNLNVLLNFKKDKCIYINKCMGKLQALFSPLGRSRSTSTQPDDELESLMKGWFKRNGKHGKASSLYLRLQQPHMADISDFLLQSHLKLSTVPYATVTQTDL